MIESVVIICDKSPIGKNSAIEAIRLGSGFMGLGEEIDCKIVFTGDAVYLLSKNADPTAVGMDSYEEALEMADLSDLELKVIDTSLNDAGLTNDDLIEYENLKIIDINDLAEIIGGATTTFRF
ncbi:MAG: DsrE family protein [Promethearchaeota archaeon]